MSPTLKKPTTTVTSLLCALALWNCSSNESNDNDGISANAKANSSVALKLEYGSTPLLDSIVLDCYGTDTLHYVHSTEDALFSMDLFPSDNWKFSAKIYANGNLMQQGDVETRLTAGSTTALSIQMHPIVGFVYIEIPIGLQNDAGIKSGKMILTSDEETREIDMVKETGSGIFNSGMLKLGTTYDISISLKDDSGKEIYSLTDTITLTEESPVPKLELKSLRSQVSLGIAIADEKNVAITLPLTSTYRKPRTGDLLITEYFSAPDSKDSSQYEFVEIYNGSIDTLILDDCSLGITSSSSMRYIPLTVSEIAPRSTIVLGNPNSPWTPALNVNTDGWYDMGNTKGNVILKCDDITLDSLYYATAPDSLHLNVIPAPKNNGKSGQLDIKRWESRKDSATWCLGYPTPGIVTYCN
ncbi:lamin tail domain-containing protein [uncultured Fibrobacter sp.]|uniref:lamin tail domain-containing protein n=1 Tax=uncultured Fibrobacter sp. TaxID=261512 RepID=UPI0026047C15|nr:lamin tail domain-containing protein [uncultured Fibrobacter sp.]